MEDNRHGKSEARRTKIKNVPIAVTPEGMWCCPSPVTFPKGAKPDSDESVSKSKPSSQRSSFKTSRSSHGGLPTPMRPSFASVDEANSYFGAQNQSGFLVSQLPSRPKVENLPRKVSIEFGEPGTSDMKVVLQGKQGLCVKLCVHKHILVEKCRFFAEKLSERDPKLSCLEIDDCEDVELYVEIVGLMYCKDMKQRLIKQSVFRVLRILKVAELLSFTSCVQACLRYLEAVPWIGEEEEKLVVSSVLRLQSEGDEVKPVLKRVHSGSVDLRRDTFSHILGLLLNSKEEKARNEMKSVVLKLLRENTTDNSVGISNEAIYASARGCLSSLQSLFRRAADTGTSDKLTSINDPVSKQIALESDNVSWLLDILLDRQAADEFSVMWANQQELAASHAKVCVVSRYHVSGISAKVFVGIGKGGLLPGKETRHMLLQTWLQPLMSDFSWLQNGCRWFDRKVVEEGIGRTILTLPLENQQSIFLAWLGSFLKAGDKCPNLQKSFEVWWRRTFSRVSTDTCTFLQSDVSRILEYEM